MPAIILPSSQTTLRSPCNHGVDQASISLQSSAIMVCSIPHTPARIAGSAFGLGGRALPRPEGGKGEEEGRTSSSPP